LSKEKATAYVTENSKKEYRGVGVANGSVNVRKIPEAKLSKNDQKNGKRKSVGGLARTESNVLRGKKGSFA
jgi:hypothetical protein